MSDTTKPELILVKSDPFDPQSFQITADDLTTKVAEPVLINVPVRKPLKGDFFRAHAGIDYTVTTALLEHDREYFLVEKPLWAALRQELKVVQIFTCISRLGTVFLWPIRLPGEDGKDNLWWSSARTIAQAAQQEWVRCTPDRDSAGYVMTELQVELAEPKWPDKSLRDLCAIAFGKQHIDSLDHPIVKLLQGRI